VKLHIRNALSFNGKGSLYWFQRMMWIPALFILTAHAQESEQALLLRAQKWFKPLPENMATAEFPIPPERVALGRRLFFDKRLSLDGTVSCETCHIPGLHGIDGLTKSIGVEHRLNARNAPTVLNAALQFKAHWDGGRDNVEDQATKALVGPASFGNPDYPAVIQKIKALGYEPDFKRAFPEDQEPIKPENWGKAIGSYERTLVTPSPFDEYLKGTTTALTPQAQQGLATFMDKGCVSCHDGPGIGGGSFEKFGLIADYWTLTGSPTMDEGRFALTKDPSDRYEFKVPSLRNVAKTPPYFHDGSVDELAHAVRIMGKVQLGLDLTPAQVDVLVAFLTSLTGEVPKQFAAETKPKQ